MNKIIRFSIPLILAFLFLGMLIWLVGASSRVTTATSISTTEGEILVTTLEDELNSDGDCSLREAIEAANTNMPVDACPTGNAAITDTITFDITGTINVISQLEVMAGGPLVIDGANEMKLTGGNTTRIIYIYEEASLILKHITLRNGSADIGGAIYNIGTLEITESNVSSNGSSTAGGGILSVGRLKINSSIIRYNSSSIGGAIYNGGSLEIMNSTLSNNNAAMGGCIENGESLTITNSILSSNSASDGGAIDNTDTMIIVNSLLTNNNSIGNAGGIHNFETITIIGSTLSGNISTDGSGGGIYNQYGKLNIANSTLTSNSAGNNGGGISNDASGVITITNSTLSGNGVSYGHGGGIYNGEGNTALVNSMIVNSPSGGDCWINLGTIIDGGHNISSDDTCGFDSANGSIPNTDPLLGSLQDNGGPTWTHALLPGSPAIDAGDDAQCPAIDQRGVPRPIDGDGDELAVCDIGSFEAAISPNLVIVTGPNEGFVGISYPFIATVEPISTTLPVTYSWKVQGQLPITNTSGLTDTVSFTWEMPDTYVITVTASNLAGSVTDTHRIIITEPFYNIYLPLILKLGEE